MMKTSRNGTLMLLLLLALAIFSGGCGGGDTANFSSRGEGEEISAELVAGRSIDGLPVGYGRELTIEDFLTPIINAQNIKLRTVADLTESERSSLSSSTVEANIKLAGRPSQSIRSIRVALTPDEGDSFKQTTNRAFAYKEEADLSRGYGELGTNYYHLGQVSRWRLQTGASFILTLTNNTSQYVEIYGNYVTNAPVGTSIQVEPLNQVQILRPNGGELYYRITYVLEHEPSVAIGEHNSLITWVSRGNAMTGLTGLTVNFVEQAYNAEYLERGYFSELPAINTMNLLGDATTSTYKTEDGRAMTEGIVSQISPMFEKKGLTSDGNTRLLLRFQTKIPSTGILLRFPYMQEQGFRLEKLDKTPLTSTAEFGYVPAEDVGNGIWQATAVLIPPDEWKPFYNPMEYMQHDFAIDTYLVEPFGETIDEYLVHDFERHWLSLHPNPIVMVHGLWGDIGTFGKEAGDLNTYNWLSGTYKSWMLSEFTYRDLGLEGLDEWNAKPDEFPNHLKKIFAQYNQYRIACTQADILAHSMGGLYSWNFVNNNPNNLSVVGYKNGMVRRIVTVATPYEGSLWANYLVGDVNSFYPIPQNATPEQRALAGWFVSNRVNILDTLQHLSYYTLGAHMLQISPTRSPIFEDGNISPSLKTLAVGSQPLQSLYSSGYPKVPMYAISGQTKGSINNLLNSAPMADPEIAKVIGKLRWIGANPDFNTLGDIPLHWTGIDKAFTALHGISAGRLRFTDNISLRFLQYMLAEAPRESKLSDVTVLFDMVFGNEDHDVIVGNSSSKWVFENQYWTAIEDHVLKAMHTEVTKHVDTGFKVWDLFAGPRSNFKEFSGTPTFRGRSSFSGLSAKGSSALGSQRITYIPPETISLDVPASAQTGTTIRVQGTVPPEIVDGTIIHIEFSSLEDFYVKTVPDVVINGEFYIDIDLDDAGLFSVQASLGQFTTADKIISPPKQLVISPTLGTITGFGFIGDIFLRPGETQRISNLYVKDDNRTWNISHPRNGIQYYIDDPRIASVDNEGNITGKNRGSTIIRATFQNFITIGYVDVY